MVPVMVPYCKTKGYNLFRDLRLTSMTQFVVICVADPQARSNLGVIKGYGLMISFCQAEVGPHSLARSLAL